MDWLMNPIVAGSLGAILVALIPLFLKNEKIGKWGDRDGAIIGKLFFALNIPVITGKAEETFKEKILLSALTYVEHFIASLKKVVESRCVK